MGDQDLGGACWRQQQESEEGQQMQEKEFEREQESWCLEYQQFLDNLGR
jgi:hypothetical protein